MTEVLKKPRDGTRDMTVGSPTKRMVGFALPILLSQLFQQLYSTADALIVGHFRGTEALAAVSSSGTLVFLLISFFTGTSLGTGIVISRYFGAKDEERVSRAIHTGVLLGFCGGALLTILGVLFTPQLLIWMKTDADVLPDAIGYFRVYFYGAIPLILYNDSRGILNALGDSRRPLIYLIVSSVLNILLDWLFVAVCGYGVRAAALATVISETVSVGLCFIHLMKKGKIYTLSLRKLRFDGPLLKEILRYGIPSGIQNSVIAIANVIVQTNINSFKKYATAAYGAYSKVEGFAFLPITSFNMAITTFVSQNLGAKRYERARTGARIGIVIGVVSAEIIGILCYIFAPNLIALFDSEPEVVAFGVREMRTISLFYCLLAYSHSIASVCRGAGKAFVPMAVMLAVWCVFRIAYIEVTMALFHDIFYVYSAYPVTWTISSVIYAIYYYTSDWIHGFDAKPSVRSLP